MENKIKNRSLWQSSRRKSSALHLPRTITRGASLRPKAKVTNSFAQQALLLLAVDLSATVTSLVHEFEFCSEKIVKMKWCGGMDN